MGTVNAELAKSVSFRGNPSLGARKIGQSCRPATPREVAHSARLRNQAETMLNRRRRRLPEPQLTIKNGPSGGAATGAVFFIGCNGGDVAPGRNRSSNLSDNRSIAHRINGQCFRPTLTSFFANELVQINLQVLNRIPAYRKTEHTILR